MRTSPGSPRLATRIWTASAATRSPTPRPPDSARCGTRPAQPTPTTTGERAMDEMLIAANPDPESRLPYLLRLPINGGMVFRTSDTWPRAKALYCYPVTIQDWPAEPDIIERIPIRSC